MKSKGLIKYVMLYYLKYHQIVNLSLVCSEFNKTIDTNKYYTDLHLKIKNNEILFFFDDLLSK